MEPILKTIAREYSRRYSNLKELCFLFPNKRCKTFLRRYFLEYGIITEDLPHILTISELVSQVTRKMEAEKIEQLFTLYNCYVEILKDGNDTKEPAVDFDSFRGWGETVLSDFNTVDINLVDVNEVFKNLKDYREIATDFLSDEQKEVMQEYFGIEDFGVAGDFWKNFNTNDGEISPLRKAFINLWQILAPLHEKFINELDKSGLGTSGSIYREATKRILEKGKNALPYKKMVAVGFNALTESERKIFKKLKEEKGYSEKDGFIDFVWDKMGPILNSEEFTASRFVNYNLKQFPMPKWLEEILETLDNHKYPEIHIISSPSNTSQTKVVGEILRGYDNDEGRKMIEESEIAVVLPDESLLSNFLYSIPDNIKDVNLTMGVSLRNTPVSSFMALLRRVYAGMREQKESKVFFVKDLKLLFTHPYSYQIFGAEAIEELYTFINDYHKVTLKLEEIETYLPYVDKILNLPSKESHRDSLFEFLKELFEFLKSRLQSPENSDEDSEVAYVEIYAQYLESLNRAYIQYDIQSSPLTVLYLADKLVSAEKIGFEGEPLTGLQVMGTLETRTLDFKEIIILSMNEGFMPRKSVSSTFIPETLRKAYGLPPARYAEEIFGYYFYRLISRAEKVYLIYDGRTISGLRGGVSRYLLQLKEFAPKESVSEDLWQYRLQNDHNNGISIEKTPEILKLIDAFTSCDEGRKNFSASTLNTYRECGVKFFLQNLLNLNSDPESGDYMDAITVGDILHEVMMELYMPKDKQKKLLSEPLIIEEKTLVDILDNPSIIRQHITNKVEKLYYNGKGGGTHHASGVLDIMVEQIEELIMEIVKYDLKLVPFNLYGCEISQNLRVKLSNGREVNFRFAIDRLDEIEIDGEKHLRIVDYKTGAKKRSAGSVEEIFEGGYQSEQIFQLFTYAWLLGKTGKNGWEDVMTEIYFVPDLISGVGGLPQIGEEKVVSFRPYLEEFNNGLEKMVESIFEEPVFHSSNESLQCANCAFKTYCER